MDVEDNVDIRTTVKPKDARVEDSRDGGGDSSKEYNEQNSRETKEREAEAERANNIKREKERQKSGMSVAKVRTSSYFNSTPLTSARLWSGNTASGDRRAV